MTNFIKNGRFGHKYDKPLFVAITVYVVFILVSHSVSAQDKAMEIVNDTELLILKSSAKELEAAAVLVDKVANIEEEIIEPWNWTKESVEALREEYIRAEEEKKKQEELLAQIKLEQERMEQERLEKERLEQERIEQERILQEQMEQERIERERLEQQRIEQEKQEELKRQERQRQQEQAAKDYAQVRESGGGVYLGNFVATGYNLSVASCGKEPSHPGYGITASGFSLAGKSRTDAMTIAVDKNVIPLGTKVYLEFGSGYEHLNGIYTARDTGVSGNHVDVFMGEEMSDSEVRSKIGKRYVNVYLM